MLVEYNYWLVVLSLIVSVQGAFVGLGFAKQLAERPNNHRLLLAGAAAVLTTAIWSMHFIGMLAARLPMPINYLVLPTLLSALAAAFFVGASVFVASSFSTSRPMLWTAAIIMGTGIVAMHFTGMSALHAKAMMQHDPVFVVASWLVGITASGLAMHYAFTDRGRTPLVFASVALGLAISGMHYTAMAGMTLHPMVETGAAEEMSLSPDALAVIVAMVAFGLSAVFLLILVPDHPLMGSAGEIKSAIVPSPEPLAHAGQGGSQVFREAMMIEVAATGANTEQAHDAAVSNSQAHLVQASLRGAVLPVRQFGSIRNMPVSLVHAVKADAHYTWVFDGRESHFCGLSIAEIEAQLEPGRFTRVHRSYLVAVEHIARFRKSGDGGIVELNSAVPYSLPVSRRQIAAVKAVLDSRA